MFVLLVLLLLLRLLILLVLFSCVAAVWCSLLFVQLASACAAPVVCADFPVVCAFCCFCCSFCCLCCCFLLLLRLLFGSPTVEPPPLPLLTFQSVKNNFTIDETPWTSENVKNIFCIPKKAFCIPKKDFCIHQKDLCPKKITLVFCIPKKDFCTPKKSHPNW